MLSGQARSARTLRTSDAPPPCFAGPRNNVLSAVIFKLSTIESKNNHLVRNYGFYYRYDTDEERAVLNRLWRLVNDRFNYLTPTKKSTGYGTDRNGRRTRIYDDPTTPLDRLLATNVLSGAQDAELLAYRNSLNPAAIARQIADLQAVLLKLAKDKTEQIYLASFPTALPDVRRGIQIKAS